MSEVLKVVKVFGDGVEIWSGIVSRWAVRYGDIGQFSVINDESFRFDSPWKPIKRWELRISDPLRPNIKPQVGELSVPAAGPKDTIIVGVGAIVVELCE